ncbi:hypothetical protein ACLOJK_037157 [Asimina triloba]
MLAMKKEKEDMIKDLVYENEAYKPYKIDHKHDIQRFTRLDHVNLGIHTVPGGRKFSDALSGSSHDLTV